MKKDEIILNKLFPPLDDLYILLKQMQNILKIEINDEDYIVGKKQLFLFLCMKQCTPL